MNQTMLTTGQTKSIDQQLPVRLNIAFHFNKDTSLLLIDKIVKWQPTSDSVFYFVKYTKYNCVVYQNKNAILKTQLRQIKYML